MFSLNDSMRYWLYTEPTDMRKSFHTLSGVVRDRMGRNPLDGFVYIFINLNRNRMKLLHCEPGVLAILQDAGTRHVRQTLPAWGRRQSGMARFSDGG